MAALSRMRLVAYLRTGRFLPPLLCCLAVFGILYGGGGAATAGEVYGVSSVVLFPVLAWQTKLLLDAEPDVQRRLARVTVGSARREVGAGLLAAILAGGPVTAIALVAPWILGGVKVSPGVGFVLAAGVWAHIVVLLPAVALGAWASRAVTNSFGYGAAVLVGGIVLALILGLKGSPLWWLGPPLIAISRLGQQEFPAAGLATLSAHAMLWTAVALVAYALVRRARP